MDKAKPWVDGPFSLVSSSAVGAASGKKLPPARAFAAEMAIVHNVGIRGMNAIYNQWDNVATRGSDKDKVDFACFALQNVAAVHEHHTHEEEVLFPKINELAGVPGLMDGNIQEHHAFQTGMDKFAEYLEEVKEGKQELLKEKKSLLDGFMPLLHTHFVQEIETLVKLEKYDDKVDWAAWFKKEVDKLMKGLILDYNFRVKVLPITLVSHDKTFENGVWRNFPPAPALLLSVLRWLYFGKMKDWWRFAGCDFYSQPKELPFA